MTVEEARAYHTLQVQAFADSDADVITAITMTHTAEAIGVALAARDAGMPVVISFTVETDGTLPSGERLGDAITAVDDATGGYPAYYMINCAHPTHFASHPRSRRAVDGADRWHPGQRLDAEPRRARRRHRAGQRRPRRLGRPVPAAA